MKHFDLVNEQDEIIGQASVQECHANPEFIHRVVHFTVIDPKTQKILISQRSLKVNFDSGMWCFMGEHVLSGDIYLEAVRRGMYDELGLTSIKNLTELSHTIFRQEFQTEFARFFVGEYNGEILRPNQAEIVRVKWISLKELRDSKDQYTKMTQFWIENCDWQKIIKDFHE